MRWYKTSLVVNLTADADDRTSRMICAQLNAPYSHASLGFLDRSGLDSSVYFESRPGSWSPSVPDGVQGPLPMDRLAAWHNRDPQAHPWACYEIALPSTHVAAAHRFALSCLGRVGYAQLQIAQLLLSTTLPVTVAGRLASRSQMICSEFVARALPPAVQVLACQVGAVSYDYIVPSGNALPSLSRAARVWYALTTRGLTPGSALTPPYSPQPFNPAVYSEQSGDYLDVLDSSSEL